MQVEEIGSALVLSFGGEINVEQMERILSFIRFFINNRRFYYVMDLSSVEHIHYRAIHLLKKGQEDLSRYEGGVVLMGMNSYLRDIFRTLGAEPYFHICGSREEAIDSFGIGSVRGGFV